MKLKLLALLLAMTSVGINYCMEEEEEAVLAAERPEAKRKRELGYPVKGELTLKHRITLHPAERAAQERVFNRALFRLNQLAHAYSQAGSEREKERITAAIHEEVERQELPAATVNTILSAYGFPWVRSKHWAE